MLGKNIKAKGLAPMIVSALRPKSSGYLELLKGATRS